MKISIAMCTFNGGCYLDKQLQSFLDQDRLPDELIVCDDGSFDNSLEILGKFSKSNLIETKIYVNSNRLGPTKNFEKAIKLCSGDIIILSDQDDVWLSGKVSSIEDFFLENDSIGCVFSNAEVVDKNLSNCGYSLWDVFYFTKRDQELVKKGSALEVLLRFNVVTGATMAFRSIYTDRVLPIPSNWVHDAWLALSMAIFSDISIIQKNLIQYRVHDKNLIGANLQNSFSLIKESLSINRRHYYNSDLDRFNTAYDYFSGWFAAEHPIIKKIYGKIEHLRTRSRFGSYRLVRIPGIFKELIRGNYKRYSLNWKVAVKDFLMF